MSPLVKAGVSGLGAIVGSLILIDGPLEFVTFASFIGAGIYAVGRFSGDKKIAENMWHR